MQTIELRRKDGTTVTLKPLDTNAIVGLEETLGKPFGTLLPELGAFGFEQLRVATLRQFLYASITSHELTLEAVGQLMDEVGIDALAKVVTDAIVITAPPETRKRPRAVRKAS